MTQSSTAAANTRTTTDYTDDTDGNRKVDLPQHGLYRGDVATVVEHHPGRRGQEPGYSLEVFNAVGETVAVVTVRASQVEPLTANELLHVRSLAPVAR